MVMLRTRSILRAALPTICFAGLWSGATAVVAEQEQQGASVIGDLRLSDATVSGALEVSGDRAVVRGGSTITAKGQTADLHLERGGVAEVCATSSLHVTSGASTQGVPAPLLFALERGAMELRTVVDERDVVITPDLRFTVRARGPLDLRMRVTQNGDTCVESLGARAPALEIVDQFGTASYELRAGQHVLFEHASLREVVDHETSPCGCPPAVPTVSVAESGRAAGRGEHVAAPGERISAQGAGSGAAAQHPFPAAESQGLTAESAAATIPQAKPGEVHAEVAATLSYDPSAGGGPTTGSGPVAGSGNGASAPASGPAARSVSGGTAQPLPAPAPGGGPEVGDVRAVPPPPPEPPGATDIAHLIGRFFRRLFGRG